MLYDVKTKALFHDIIYIFLDTYIFILQLLQKPSTFYMKP